MPLSWKRGRNPYSYNYFGILGVGPNTPANQIAALAREIERRAAAGKPPKVSGEEVSAHEISEASARLRDDHARAQELLLVHPEVQFDDSQIKKISERLRETADIPRSNNPPPLPHPLAIFWFVPQPGPDAAEKPALGEFPLIAAGSPEDLALDIVFDS